MLVDVHCHLDFKDFDSDLDKVIARCKNFKALICNGVNPESNRKVLSLSKKYSLIKPALGYYPTEAIEVPTDILNKEIEFIKQAKPIAIGEVGIDYHIGKNPEKQKQVFKKFIELAKYLDIPIIVHSRKAEEDVLNLLEESGIKKVIMHCFSGNAEQTKRAHDLGYLFSIPPTIIKNKTFKKLAKRIDADRILTETDAPFLSPYGNIKRNEPLFIKETIRKLSEIKKLPEEEIQKSIIANFNNIFSISQ
jgi:TatD DNase family protein